MYVSIRDDVLLAAGYQTLADGLRDLGLAAVELWVDRDGRVRALTPTAARPTLSLADEPDELAAQCDGAGVRIAAFCLGNDFNAPDRDAEVAWVAGVVAAAARLGVPAVRIDAIMRGERDLPLPEREQIFARAVREVLARTDGLPVDLGIENHGRQGNDPAFLDGLLALVGAPRLGLTMDTGNFYWAGNPLGRVYEILAHFAPHAKHTHVKNIRYPEAMRDVPREPGYEYGRYVSPIPEGDIDHGRVAASLKAAGYDRDLCIEDESLGRYDPPQRRAHLRAAADHLRSLL